MLMPLFCILGVLASAPAAGQVFNHPNTTVDPTPGGDLRTTPIHHAMVLFQFNELTIYTDPYGVQRNHGLPKADLILITHMHEDHFDVTSLRHLAQPSTVFIVPRGRKKNIGASIPHAEVIDLPNGRSTEVRSIGIQAVAAYNVLGRDPSGMPYHFKGEDNGYVLDFKGYRVYVAGDTEKVKEMEALGQIDVAFLPTMRPACMDELATVQALKLIKPRVYYPYHYLNVSSGAIHDISRVIKDATALGITVRVARIYQ